MKKIVFVEKDDGSAYDPVSTFFAKKTQSTVKPPVAPKSTNKPMPSRASASKPTYAEKKQLEKEKPITGKIGRKGDYIPPNRPGVPKKQQTIYHGNSRKAIKHPTDESNSQLPRTLVIDNDFNEQAPITINEKQTPVKLEPIDRKQGEEITALKRKIKQLEESEVELRRKLEQWEEKEAKFYKTEQKLAKIQKEHKACGQETKDLAKQVKDKDEELKKLYSKDDIPYSKKREVLLMNQINMLRKANQELVSRVKSYKGTDMVQLSIQNNKKEILNEYEGGQGEEQSTPDRSKIESLAYRLVEQTHKYLANKVNAKEYAWVEEKKFLLELTGIAKEMSLECLQTQLSVPLFSQAQVNLYDEVEKYRSRLEPLLSKHDLNLVISEGNIQLINMQHEKTESLITTKQLNVSNWHASPQKFKKAAEASSYYLAKMKEVMRTFETHFQMQDILLAHCLAQLSFVQGWVQRASGAIKEQIGQLSARLKEAEGILSLGDMGKESLFVYMSENIGEMLVKIPDLNLRVAEMGSIFKPERTKK